MTDRIPLDHLTSDQLDALYARIAVLEHVAASNKRHVRTILTELESADRTAAEAQHDRDQHAAALARIRRLADRIQQGVPWTANADDTAAHIHAALDEPAAAEDLTGYTAPDPPIGCITATYTEPSSWLLAGTRDLDIPVMEPEPSDPTQCTGEEGFCPEHGFHRHSLKQTGEPEPDICRPVEVDGETIRVRGSREFTEQEREFAGEIVRAARRKYASEHPERGAALFSLRKQVAASIRTLRRDDPAEDFADAMLAVVLPTTRTTAELTRQAEADVSRVIDLYERWVKAGPPPLGTSVSRWWDTRLAELHTALNPKEQ